MFSAIDITKLCPLIIFHHHHRHQQSTSIDDIFSSSNQTSRSALNNLIVPQHITSLVISTFFKV